MQRPCHFLFYTRVLETWFESHSAFQALAQCCQTHGVLDVHHLVETDLQHELDELQ